MPKKKDRSEEKKKLLKMQKDAIKSQKYVTSADNPQIDTWTPVSEEYLEEMFCGDKGVDLDKTNWDALDYNAPRDHDWYAQKFPGFPDEIIDILVKCDGMYVPEKDKNNTWEQRQNLNKEITKEKYIVNFD